MPSTKFIFCCFWMLVACRCTSLSLSEEQLAVQGTDITNSAFFSLRRTDDVIAAEQALCAVNITSHSRWRDMAQEDSIGHPHNQFFCDQLSLYDFMTTERARQNHTTGTFKEFFNQYAQVLEVTMDSICRLWVCIAFTCF